jgi:hypothetical protein
MPDPVLLVIAVFSRHASALDGAADRLEHLYGPLALASPAYDFRHTRYYEKSMGVGLRKRLLAFDRLMPPDCLPDVKRAAIALEREIAASGSYPEPRPVNIDPGYLSLGKFVLATTKDRDHRIYLRDGVFAEVTLHFQAGSFAPWPWTYADYRETVVLDFLGAARAGYYRRVRPAEGG